jgi:hypothetical protein
MFQLKIDVTDCGIAATEAKRLTSNITGDMRRIGKAAAEFSKRNHTYQNRTYDAEDGTKSVTEKHGDGVFTVVMMDVEYASYLQRRGLTGLEDGVSEAERDLEYYFDAFTDQVTKL